MTQQRDIERLLDQWLSDGPTQSPDRVLGVVADRIELQRQRPAWRLERRLPQMNTPLRAFAAVAAVVLLLIAGFSLIGGFAGVGVGGPSVTPVPTATPIPIPTGDGAFAAGTYALTLDQPFPKLIITLPDGWNNASYLGKDSNDTTLMKVVTNPFLPGDEVYAHPCQWSGTEIQPGPTVDALASALAAVPLRNATTPVEVTVDGYNGKYLEWSVPDDADFAACDKDDAGEARFMSWSGRSQQAPGQVDRLWILDIDGTRFVMDAWFLKDATEADRAELTQIMKTIRFEP